MMAHRARKRFGQNFLHDRGVIARIVQAINPARDDRLVEIGPGRGALTEPLLAALDLLHVIEIDRDLIAALRQRWPLERLIIHEGDVLETDFAALAADCRGPLRLVGNLPYNISTPILFNIARAAGAISDAYFMLQREVVERMVAAPDTAEYGRLSVSLQVRFSMDLLFTVGGGAFTPAPKVESAIVRLVPRPNVQLPPAFDRVVTQAFSMRRKTLRNSLANTVSAAQLESLGIDPGLRAEVLHYADYQRIARSLNAEGPGSV